jgi:hypothetical protein
MNSFFSTLAGSTGGLIGVISAFLISKILTREEKLLIIKEEIELAIIKAEKHKQTLNNIDTKSFIEDFREKGLNELIDEFSIDSEKNTVDYANQYFSKYDNFKEVFIIVEKELNKLEKIQIDKIINNLKPKIENDYPEIKSALDYLNSIDYTLKIKDELLFDLKIAINDTFFKMISKTIEDDYPDLKSPDEYLSPINNCFKSIFLENLISDKISDLKNDRFAALSILANSKRWSSFSKIPEVSSKSLYSLSSSYLMKQKLSKFKTKNVLENQRIEI